MHPSVVLRGPGGELGRKQTNEKARAPPLPPPPRPGGAAGCYANNGSSVLGYTCRSSSFPRAWRNSVQVAFDIADGLNYLRNYTNPPYVHKNFKSSNVLLDTRLRAKVSNFGLARAVAAGGGAQMTRNVVGTEGYLAPEYLEDRLIGPHLDVFAFGVVVLELLSGKEAAPARVGTDSGGGEALLLWQEAQRLAIDGGGVREKVPAFMDARLHGDYPSDVVFALLALALRCVAREPRARPSMGEVLLSLSAVYGSTLERDDPLDPGNSGSTVTESG
ncbi:protein LYK5-like [Setaria italica]|uniref:protein LYK5-like n=1 Tax=Setaria italica TaxID=4555 RepID=UPI000350F86D|nr:protein LYK5-like [Setaria italica]